jgi:hypothetical protein
MVWGLNFNLININQIDKTNDCKRLSIFKRSTHTVPDKENSAELKFYICNHHNYGYNTDYIQDYINIEGHNRKITTYVNRFGGCNLDASVHYQGHVYFSKAIVFIHKENKIPGKNYYNQSYIEGVTNPADYIQDYINIEGHNRKITTYVNRFGGCNLDASVHYQGQVYFSKAIVFIHKENKIPGKNYYNQSYIEGVTNPADFFAENEEDKEIQIPFEKGYSYNGVSKYIIKRIKVRNTKYPYKLSKYMLK